jgi:hypothetical protein
MAYLHKVNKSFMDLSEKEYFERTVKIEELRIEEQKIKLKNKKIESMDKMLVMLNQIAGLLPRHHPFYIHIHNHLFYHIEKNTFFIFNKILN